MVKSRRRGIRKPPAERFFDVLILLFFVLATVLFLYPFLYVLALSFNDAADTIKGGIYLWPRKFSVEAYKVVFRNDALLGAYGITILRTVVGTFCSVAATGMFAYGLSKKKLMFRNVYFGLCVVTMFFGGGLIPSVILMKSLHLTNTFLVYIIPGLISVFNMLIMKSFFLTLPGELEEAAVVDGCNDLMVFIRIIIPASMPIIATIGLFNAVAQWNSWFDAYIYVSNEKLMPLQTILQRIINQNEAATTLKSLALGDDIAAFRVTPYSIQLATMMISIGPIVLIYPFFQKYFAKGMMIGAVKG